MSDDPKPPGSARGRDDLEARLAEAERRLARLEQRPPEPAGDGVEREAALARLRQAVADLAADTRDLRNQLDRLVAICERLVGGVADRAGGVARPGVGPRVVALVGRAARRAARAAAGAVRRAAGPGRVDRTTGLHVDVRLAKRPAGRAPELAVVVRTTDDPTGVAPEVALGPQTVPPLELAVWNEERSTAVVSGADGESRRVAAADRPALAAALRADAVVDLGGPRPTLHPTFAERCRWALASEGVPLVGSSPVPGAGWEAGPTSWWAGTQGRGRGASSGGIAKSVAPGGWGAASDSALPSGGSGRDRGYLAAGGVTGAVEHEVAPIVGLVEAPPGPDDRPALLVVTSERGAGPAAWLLRVLGDGVRATVVATEGAERSAPVRALTELAPRTYPVSGFLEPAVWPSLVADLARAHGVGTVLRIDAPVPVSVAPGSLRVVDLPMTAASIGDGADLVLALGRGIADGARERGVEAVEVTAGPRLPGDPPLPEELAGVRSAYGVPDDARLVLAVGELEADTRPEDVAAVARRLRHRPDVHVMLAGRGRLAGSVSDLAGYFGLERFTIAPPGHPLKQLVAVCDCLLHTAEVDPWPESVAAALALGRSVVATDIDGVRELCAAAGFDRCILRPPGDVDGLAEAVVEALDSHRAPRATRKAWNEAAKRGEAAARTVAAAVLGAPDANAGAG